MLLDEIMPFLTVWKVNPHAPTEVVNPFSLAWSEGVVVYQCGVLLSITIGGRLYRMSVHNSPFIFPVM